MEDITHTVLSAGASSFLRSLKWEKDKIEVLQLHWKDYEEKIREEDH